jgi:solute carrier family 9 (sodium/hydrogen exchanger), member 6/7
MFLFTSALAGEKVTNYVKPLFITIAVICTHYATLSLLWEAIDFFLRHTRVQRNEESLHAYQVMLFWAGSRGAVGVALEVGVKDTHAQVLRTMVLMFGRTTARMLEVL